LFFTATSFKIPEQELRQKHSLNGMALHIRIIPQTALGYSRLPPGPQSQNKKLKSK